MRSFPFSGHLDLAWTLGPLVHSRRDPTARVRGQEAIRATRTPAGPASLHVQVDGQRVLAQAWGPGGDWTLDRVPDLLGLDIGVVVELDEEAAREEVARREGGAHSARHADPDRFSEGFDPFRGVRLLEAGRLGCMDAVAVKLSKFGGLGAARLARDLCIHLGARMCIEDVWGSDIVTAAALHLAAATTPRAVLNVCDLSGYVTPRLDAHATGRKNGQIRVPGGPGLGLDPDPGVLGEPVAIFE